MAKKYYPDIDTVCEEIRQFLVLMSCSCWSVKSTT